MEMEETYIFGRCAILASICPSAQCDVRLHLSAEMIEDIVDADAMRMYSSCDRTHFTANGY